MFNNSLASSVSIAIICQITSDCRCHCIVSEFNTQLNLLKCDNNKKKKTKKKKQVKCDQMAFHMYAYLNRSVPLNCHV